MARYRITRVDGGSLVVTDTVLSLMKIDMTQVVNIEPEPQTEVATVPVPPPAAVVSPPPTIELQPAPHHPTESKSRIENEGDAEQLAKKVEATLTMAKGTLVVYEDNLFGDVLCYEGGRTPKLKEEIEINEALVARANELRHLNNGPLLQALLKETFTRPEIETFIKYRREKMYFMLVGRRRENGSIEKPIQASPGYVRFGPDGPQKDKHRHLRPGTSPKLLVLRYPTEGTSEQVPPPPIPSHEPQSGTKPPTSIPPTPPPRTLQEWRERQTYDAVKVAQTCNELWELTVPKIIPTQEGTYCEILTFFSHLSFDGHGPKGDKAFSGNCEIDGEVSMKNLPTKAEGDLGFETVWKGGREGRHVKRFRLGDNNLHLIRCWVSDENKGIGTKNRAQKFYVVSKKGLKKIDDIQFAELKAKVQRHLHAVGA